MSYDRFNMTDHLLISLKNHISAVSLVRSPSLISPHHFARSQGLIEYYTNIAKSVVYTSKTVEGQVL